jgi:hypothetical protein
VTGTLTRNLLNSPAGGSTVEAVNRRPLTAAVRVRSQFILCGI